ncbi:MAG: glutamate synthase-related protein, partial [Candidatus Bathyarchaeia archaeon]
MRSYLPPEYIVERDNLKCTRCKICIEQCTYGTHYYNVAKNIIESRSEHCVNCQRCVFFCPVSAITIRRNPNAYKENYHWTNESIISIKRQAETGSVLLSGMGCDKPYLTYWDRLLLNACQVTNPPIDPIREPIEIRTYLGRKPPMLEFEINGGDITLETKIAPNLCVETPILFAAMSYGAVNLNVHEALARAAENCGTYFNCGEGGLHPNLFKYGDHIIVQAASGRFGVDSRYLNAGAAIEIKIGQGAKPGIGGHLPGEKVSEDIAMT